MKPPRAKACPGCGVQMPVNRGVCPECGHMTVWFKIRLCVGCGSILLAGIGLVILLITAMLAGK